MRGIEGKTVVVTGAAKGIGRAAAQRFLEEKASKIAILDNDIELAEKTAIEMDPEGETVFALKCDISDRNAVKETVDKILEKAGRIDILINNASVTRDRMFHKMEDSNWDTVININLNGTFNMCRAVYPLMREQGCGVIVNVSSVSAYGNIGQANYAASKAAMLGLTKTLAKEGGKYNVRVNAVLPAYILTDMYATVPEEVRLRAMENHIFMRRMGTADEVASGIVFLASDDASFITGHDLIIGGGVPSST